MFAEDCLSGNSDSDEELQEQSAEAKVDSMDLEEEDAGMCVTVSNNMLFECFCR